MATDAQFFTSTLAELSELTATVRTFAVDTKVPSSARYPIKQYAMQMPQEQTTGVETSERQDYFTLTFKTLKAPVRKYTVHASSVRTVGQVKRHLSRIANIPVTAMRLVLGGKGLVDGKLIGDYNVPQDAVIQIITRPAGTATPPVVGEEAEQLRVLAEEMNNPLRSVLGQEQQKEEAPAETVMKRSIAGLAATNEYTSDASSEAGEEVTTMEQATRDQLQKTNSAFRNSLRDLVHMQFGTSQAMIVEKQLDTYFSTL
ncbi:hypothetical protein EV175_002908 [Coemansia sp. RSA 1933]|nr:hypothetical protein EV175_002908 [Coemansia sp. RSA 1933]